MRLLDALRLNSTARLALVGAGGKTTALFCLAGEIIQAFPEEAPAVLLTASTHLAVEQVRLADHHFVLNAPGELDPIAARLPGGKLLFTGPPTADDRVLGLAAPLLNGLFSLAEERRLPLLVEADGSRRLPLKAPAAHEPAIPPWCQTVIVVAGLSGVGQSLDAEHVHRPERFAALSGLALGQPVTVDALARVLLSPQGGLQGIPPQARRVLLLNQADTAAHQAQASRVAEECLGAYQAVLSAALAPPHGAESVGIQSGVLAVYERVAGIILAAGGSTRLGQAKQVLPWRNLPLVRHVALAALQASLEPVIVITGYAAADVGAAVSDLPITLVHNPDWQQGQSTSVCSGVRALPAQTGAAIFLLADQPRIPPSLLRRLVETHATTLSPLVATQVQGQRANPVLFDRRTFPDLLALSGDSGGRALFSRYRAAWVPWHDPRVALDVDTLDDYQRLCEAEGGL